MADDVTVRVDGVAVKPAAARSDSSAGGGAPERERQMQAMAGVVVVVVDGGEGCSATATAAKKKTRERVVVECRICQEEDEVQAMESPCACSGTLKFAHRKCIQRWCNKKGDINCEICNQVFSPNYSLPPATISPDLVAIDVRRAWGPHINLRDSHLIALAAAERQFLRSDYEEYAVENSSSIACLRSVALVFQVSVLQFAGFLLPCYVMARSWYIQSRRRQV
ncbi:hypothetical protein BT93_A0210 [Corymbia citriodora subsp. variegata]|nr:hypothetical protein BT93_A0210 [Corymbia citriodora subsp. variegata]